MTRKLVSYRLADDLQQSLKARASDEGISATELVNRLLRQGLGEASTDQMMQHRVSQLEQVLHQLEKRVAAGDGPTSDLHSLFPSDLADRLLALEQKIDGLTAGVEQGCRSLQQLRRSVSAAPELEPPGASSPLPTPALTAYPADWSEEVVQMPLAALRKLLADQAG